ncbi:MAG TPA: YCF48-related protein [Ignavibacteria bacterium]|nr:YCF48-related protein [Ignavibacteria bacterium]
MKRIILSLLISFYAFSFSNAQPWSLYQTGVPYSLFAVDFLNANTGVAVGQGGTIIQTLDGGEEWTLRSQTINIWLNDVSYTPVGVFAVGMGGVIMRSVDNGATWQVSRAFSHEDHTLRGVAYNPYDNTVHAVGYAGSYYVLSHPYTNGTWVQRFDIPYTMHSIAFAPNAHINERGIIAGTDGKVWRSTNGGSSWTPRNTNRYDYMNDVVFLNDDEAMICGNNGTILRSTNWGGTWSVNLQFLTIEHLRSIDMFSDGFNTKVTICGDHGKIMTSNDNGFTFIDQLNGEGRHMYGVSLLSITDGITVGEIGSATSGAMYVTSANGIVGISNISSEIPGSFTLEQNYPNPFNPVTNIKFSLPVSEQVKLSVFDMTGREVKTLVNTKLNAGSYEYQFDAFGLSSGVYIYKLVSNSFSQTKKMTLIK